MKPDVPQTPAELQTALGKMWKHLALTNRADFPAKVTVSLSFPEIDARVSEPMIPTNIDTTLLPQSAGHAVKLVLIGSHILTRVELQGTALFPPTEQAALAAQLQTITETEASALLSHLTHLRQLLKEAKS